MMLPYTSSPLITLDEDGTLLHFEPPVANRPGKVSEISVSSSGGWIQVGCTRISREAWEYIVNRVSHCTPNAPPRSNLPRPS